MAGAIKIDFQIAGKEDVVRAMQGISKTATKLARDGAVSAANEQKAAARDAANAQKAAARDALNAQKAAAKEAAAAQKAAAKEAAAFQREMDKASERAFKQRVREQVKAEREAARERERIVTDAHRQWQKGANSGKALVGDIAGGAGRGFKSGVKTIAAVGALAAGGLGTATVVDAVRGQMSLEERAAMLRNSSGKGKKEFDSVATAKKISSELGVDAGEVMGGFEKIAAKAGGDNLMKAVPQLEALSKVARGAGVSMTDLGDVVATLVNRGVETNDLVTTVEALVKQGQDGAVEFKDLATMLDASSGALNRFQMGEKDKIMSAGGLTQMARTFGKSSAAEATNAVVDLARDLGGKADIVQQLTGGQQTTVHVKGKKTKKMVDGKMVETTEGDSTRTQWSGGIEVGTDTTRAKLRNLNDLLPEMIGAAIKNGTVGKLTGEGGVFTGNSVSIVAPLIEAATQGIVKDGDRWRNVKAGETAQMTGAEAARAILDQFNAATLEAGKSEKMLAEVMSTDSAKLARATEKLKNDLGDKLAPAIAQATPNIIKLGQAFGDAVVWIAENPKKAAAGFVALSTALGAAEVGFSKLASSVGGAILDKLFSKATPVMNVAATTVNVAGVPGGGGGGGGGGPGGAARGGAAAAASAAAAPVAAVLAIGAAYGIAGGAGMDKGAAMDDKTRSLQAQAANEAARLRNGGGDRAGAEAMIADLEKTQGVRGALGRFWEGATQGARGLMKGDITASNVVGALPVPAAIAGVGAAVNGGNTSEGTAAAIAELKAALAQPTKLEPGSTINIGNVGDIAAAVNNNAQSPKAAPP